MTRTLGSEPPSRPLMAHAAHADSPKNPSAESAAANPTTTSLANTIASSNETPLATIKQEQADFLRLARHFDVFVVDAAVSPRVAAALGTVRQIIATRSSELKAKPAAVPRAATARPANDRSAVPLPGPSTWASLASRPAPAATTNLPSPPAHPLPPRPAVTMPPPMKQTAAQPVTDLRVMVRLPEDSPSRQISAGAALVQARQIAGDNASDIRSVQFVRSGLAILPPTTTARNRLLSHAESFKNYFSASAVEGQSDVSRDTFIVPYAPISGTLGHYREEIYAVLSVPVLSLRMAPNQTDEPARCSSNSPRDKSVSGKSPYSSPASPCFAPPANASKNSASDAGYSIRRGAVRAHSVAGFAPDHILSRRMALPLARSPAVPIVPVPTQPMMLVVPSAPAARLAVLWKLLPALNK